MIKLDVIPLEIIRRNYGVVKNVVPTNKVRHIINYNWSSFDPFFDVLLYKFWNGFFARLTIFYTIRLIRRTNLLVGVI